MEFHSTCIYSLVLEMAGPWKYRTQSDSYVVALLYSTHGTICFLAHLSHIHTYIPGSKRQEGNDANQVTPLLTSHWPTLNHVATLTHKEPKESESFQGRDASYSASSAQCTSGTV